MTQEARSASDATGNQASKPQTLGEERAGLSFNPSGREDVNAIKRAAADFIDLVEAIEPPVNGLIEGGEVRRLKALAQTAIEEAAMWAVKAATKPAATDPRGSSVSS